ncbi:MAG: hypothetical protein RLZZ558_424 [Planctomycetota bacterium]
MPASSLRSLLVLFLITILPAAAVAQQAVPAAARKMALAVGEVKVTPSLTQTLEARGQARELGRVRESLDSQLISAFQQTRKFDVLARSDLKDVLKEQDLGGSGNVDTADPAAAKAFRLAGAQYVVVSTIDDFQDNVQEAEFAEIGRKATRRQVRLSMVAKIYDTTSGRLLETANLQLDNSAFVRNPEFLTGQQGGSLSEKAIQEMARLMAEKAAQRVTDVLLPAKVLVVRDGQVTINRGDGTGIAAGQIWQVFAQGEALIDPDTGENLGSEEVPVGMIRITSVLPKTAVGELCGDNRGVAAGCVVRVTQQACPATAPGAVRSMQGGAPAPPTLPSRPAGIPSASPNPASPAGTPSAPAPQRRVAAIFVKDRGEVPPEKVMVMEDYLVAQVGDLCFTTLSREDVINAVRQFSRQGANAGNIGDPQAEADRLFSDQASALALTRLMNADYALVVSLTALAPQLKNFEGYGVKTQVLSQTLDATYRLLDRASGSVIDSGMASATEQLRGTPNLQQQVDLIDPLLRKVATDLAGVMARRCEQKPLPEPASLAGAGFTVTCTMLDVSVPDIVMDKASGRFTVTANPLSVSPVGVQVEVDGATVGSTPGTFRTTPGLHKLRLRAPGFRPWEGTINVTDGFDLRVAMQMDDQAFARWRETTRFLQDLKEGQQLTDAQVDLIRGMAEFLRNSQYRVDYKVDTNQAPPLVVPSLWGGIVPPVIP